MIVRCSAAAASYSVGVGSAAAAFHSAVFGFAAVEQLSHWRGSLTVCDLSIAWLSMTRQPFGLNLVTQD